MTTSSTSIEPRVLGGGGVSGVKMVETSTRGRVVEKWFVTHNVGMAWHQAIMHVYVLDIV